MAATNPVPTGQPGGPVVPGVSARLPGITARSGPLGRMAQAQGRAVVHRRGLRNSSLAAQASHKALLDYAVPIAQADTTTDLQNQQRIAENARHAVDASIARYGIDSANARNEATLELQRYGIDEQTARHAVDAEFKEKQLRESLGFERERLTSEEERHGAELQAEAEALEQRLTAEQTNLLQQIQADREGQERAIAANDRQLAQELAQRQRESQARLGAIRAEIAAANRRHATTYRGAGARPRAAGTNATGSAVRQPGAERAGQLCGRGELDPALRRAQRGRQERGN